MDEASAEDSPVPSTVSKQLQPKQYSEANTEDMQVLHIIELSEAPRFRQPLAKTLFTSLTGHLQPYL